LAAFHQIFPGRPWIEGVYLYLPRNNFRKLTAKYNRCLKYRARGRTGDRSTLRDPESIFVIASLQTWNMKDRIASRDTS
jgi:hypothetical protein